MHMWGGYWGMPWVGFGWIVPLLGLLFIVVMAFGCFRMMRRMAIGSCMGGHGGPGEIQDLRREIQELKEEIRNLQARP